MINAIAGAASAELDLRSEQESALRDADDAADVVRDAGGPGCRRRPRAQSSTDANAAHGRGIPAITVGVTTGANAHRLDEYVDLGPIPAGLASLEALVDELAGPVDDRDSRRA